MSVTVTMFLLLMTMPMVAVSLKEAAHRALQGWGSAAATGIPRDTASRPMFQMTGRNDEIEGYKEFERGEMDVQPPSS